MASISTPSSLSSNPAPRPKVGVDGEGMARGQNPPVATVANRRIAFPPGRYDFLEKK